MKLFDDLEAFRFPEENLILITRRGYLYYIYKPQYKHWYIHKNPGNDMMTVSNYPDISREELAEAMGEKFPEKETDISVPYGLSMSLQATDIPAPKSPMHRTNS